MCRESITHTCGLFFCFRSLTKTLALIGRSVDEDLGGDDVPEGQEHLHELGVAKLLGQVVDEQVATFRS